ncbi:MULTISPECIES: RNA-directed DNA polymerase [Paenibacillus]|uniref:RNA-directed DNA polymerase n=1 Tax=Paenibacillus TaxID=44249 RepID=UPI00026C6175|nr:RNA-directed DNA polymerase [Paenibacillus peoriae]MEC0183124.1 RNA-directed DNA polymerase [Paenibacillus peoriae]
MKLTMYNLLKCGFFSDNLPSKIFTSIELADFIKSHPATVSSNLTNLKSKKIDFTPCLFISSYKSDLERRIIALPHIDLYSILCENIEKHRLVIENKFKQNEHSYSNIILPNQVKGYNVFSRFMKNYYDRTIYSAGYKYLLNIDLSKCYENIYTHSLTWALYGKEDSKNELKKSPKQRDTKYLGYDEFDKLIRSINNNETKGIPTGPLSSRIVSEIILSSIDEILDQEGYHFKRYVDDYNFYFRNESEINEFIPHFQNILYDYKLHINTEKTEINKYPYQLNQDFVKVLREHDFSKDGYLKYIEKMIELHQNNNKGVLKYGLKILSSHNIANKEKGLVFSHLVNIILTFPNMAEYVHNIILKNNFAFDKSIQRNINDILESCLKYKHELETIWLIAVMCSLDMNIEINNLVSIINYSEPLSTIMALDYIEKKKLNRESKIQTCINDLKRRLSNESIYGDKWLLIYEINRNNWIKGLKQILNQSLLLKDALNNDVRFYLSPIN